MKVPAGKIDSFIRALPANVRAVLLYGADTGLADERALSLAKAITGDVPHSFSSVQLTPAALSADPALLLDEMLAMAFGGGRRVITIRGAGEETAKALRPALAEIADHGNETGLVIALSGSLAPRAALRRLFEEGNDCASLPCYPDDDAALANLLRDSLAEHGVSIDRDAQQLAVSLLGPDRQANRREIEKLALYVGPQETADISAVTLCFGNSAASSTDTAIFSAADGNYPALDKQLEQIWAEGLSAVAVLRSAQRHFQRLHNIAIAVRAGSAADEAIKRLRPPVFWQNVPQLRAQAKRWSVPRVETALQRLTEAEISAKSTGLPAELVCARALLAIAQLARLGTRA